MTFDFLTHSLLAVLAAQASATMHGTPISVRRWSSYEITLTATGHYDKAYVSVDLVGVFTGPNGESILAKGFWDGGQTFRIRFTPTAEGSWTFDTVSDDPGLDGQIGSVACIKATDGSHGFVRQSGARSRAWIHDDGTAVQGDRIPVRLQARERNGTESGPFDLADLQGADRLVADALSKGLVVEIGLFDGCDGAVDGSAMYRDVEYMAARYGAYPNVVWCLPSAASSESRRDLWRSARGLLTTLDPYFVGGTGPRVIAASCAPTS